MSEPCDEEPYNYELLESCHIDHGELEGISLQEIFILGVEWEMIRQQCYRGKAFTRTMHKNNEVRVKKMLDSYGRDFSYVICEGADGWVNLTVHAL